MRSRASAAALSACSVAATAFTVAALTAAAMLRAAFVIPFTALFLFENAARAFGDLRFALFAGKQRFDRFADAREQARFSR